MQLQRGSELTILCPENAEPLLQEAAAELRLHLAELGLAPAVRSEPTPGTPCIVLAPGPDNPFGADCGSGRDSGVIRTTGPDTLTIAAATDRGVLNGAYVFLEEVLGIRWLTPATTFFPDAAHFDCSDCRIRFEPPFTYRSLHNVNAWCLDWAARHRLNYFVDHEPQTYRNHPRLQDSFDLAGNQNCHNVYELLALGTPDHDDENIALERVFAEYPEYFALLAGSRRLGAADSRRPDVSEQSGQICLTHPDMARVLARGLRRLSDQDPRARFVSLSLRDNYDYCECESCRTAAARSGGMTHVYFELANRIAELLEPHCPQVLVNLLAYHGTQPPPQNVKLRPNLQIRYCPIRVSQFHAFDESEHNTIGGLNYETPPSMAGPAPQLRRWREICDHVMVWYYTLHLPILHPQPDLRAHDRNLRLMRDLGVEGVFVEDLSHYPENALNHVRAYVLARLLWNPDLDLKALIREFVTLYYGNAAENILACIRLLHEPDSWDWQRWPDADGHSRWDVTDCEESWSWFDETPDPDRYQTPHFFTLYGTRPPLTPEACRHAWETLEEAAASVRQDPELRARVEEVRVPVAYAVREYLEPGDPLQTQARQTLDPVLAAARAKYGDNPALLKRLFGI